MLKLHDVRTEIDSSQGIVVAVDGVTLDIRKGETFALVGESGSGKSVTALSIARLLPENARVSAGTIALDGLDLTELPERAMRDVRGGRISMIFQEPATSLNPVLTVGEQIIEVIETHTPLRGHAARERALDWLRRVGIPEPARRIDSYPFQMSGGQKQRVMIAVALAAEPELLIADEPTTALDVTVQKQILDLLQSLQQERHMAVILITHDLAVVADRADEVAVMYAGRLVERAPTAELFDRPLMPYTHGLLASIPKAGSPPHTRLEAIPGRPPRVVGPAKGCAFADRCPLVQDRCRVEMPELTIDPGTRHWYRCWFPMRKEGG